MRCFPKHTCHFQTYAKAFSLSHLTRLLPCVRISHNGSHISYIDFLSYLLPFSSLQTGACCFTSFWVFFMHLSYETNIRDQALDLLCRRSSWHPRAHVHWTLMESLKHKATATNVYLYRIVLAKLRFRKAIFCKGRQRKWIFFSFLLAFFFSAASWKQMWLSFNRTSMNKPNY